MACSLPRRQIISFDCVVVGGGVAGAAVALALAERNVSVAIVDEGTGGGEATVLAGALLAPQYSVPTSSALFPMALDGFRRFAGFARHLEERGGLEVPFRRTGMLVANLDEAHAEAAHGVVKRHRALHLGAEIVQPDDAAQAGAAVSTSAVSYIWFPEAGVVPGFALARALCSALVRRGVSLVQGRRVRRVALQGGRVIGVELAGGSRIAAGQVVVCAGLGTPSIAGLPRALPLATEAVHVVRGTTWRPRLKAVVGTPEGAWVARLPSGVGIAAQLGGGLRPQPRPSDAIHDALHGSVEALVGRRPERSERRSYRGLLSLGRDGLPIAGADGEVQGLAYAVGYGGSGILLAPVLGGAVADEVLGTPAAALQPLRVDRFAQA